MDKKPIFLNPELSIAFYNGGADGAYGIANVLLPGDTQFHCSGEGKNFDLLLESKEPITVTNVIVIKAPGCTCAIRSGAVHVYEEKPSPQALKAKYVDLAAPAGEDPHAFFLVPDAHSFSQIKLNKWRSGKYIHVKFISPHQTALGVANIDVAFVGFVGFKGKPPAEYDVGHISDALGIVPKLKVDPMILLEAGKTGELRALLQQYPNTVDQIRTGKIGIQGTLLHFAALLDKFEVAKLLVEEFNANLDIKTVGMVYSGQTPSQLGDLWARHAKKEYRAVQYLMGIVIIANSKYQNLYKG